MVNGKRVKVLLIIVLAMVMVLSACGGSNNGQSTGGTAGTPSQTESGTGGEKSEPDEEPPVEIRVMTHFFSPTPPSEENPVKKEIEKATNSKLKIEWVSSNNYGDKFNVTLASGDIPDLILVGDPFNPVFRNAAQQGAFWDVSPYIKDYPNLSAKIADVAWELTKINGGNFGVPRPRPSEGDTFLIIRKDWLDNVGMEPPTTSEELYEVMKAFVEQDPDGNNANDTVAFAGQVNQSDMGVMGNLIGMFTGTTGDWKLVDGQLVSTTLLAETRDGLEYLARAYNDQLIPVDFASLKLTQVKDMFKAGKAGIINEKSGAMQEYYDSLVQLNPDFEFTNLLPLTDINGYNPKGPGFAGLNAIPKSVPEEKMKQILAVLDKWSDDDVFKLHQQGIEGVHHKVENGEVVVNTEQVQADAIAEFNQIVYVSDPYASTVKAAFPDEVQKLYGDIQDEREKTSVSDIALGLYSETGATYLPELKKKEQDLKTKIILGREPIEAWDAFVENVKQDRSFMAMTEEINEAYNNR